MPEISRFFGIVIRLPPRLLALVIEWATIHESALLDNWNRLRADQPPVRIAPLE